MARDGTFRIEVSPELDRWAAGFGSMGASMSRSLGRRWYRATHDLYEASQDVVHVVSGALKASGRIESEAGLGTLVGVVAYGGGNVDYAEYEAARGGSHDYLMRAYLETEDRFKAALPEAFGEVIATWR